MTRFEDIKAFAFDVDGVFTDGLVLAMPDGDLLRQFNSKDCFGVRTAVDNGFPCAIITGGVSQSLLHRARSRPFPAFRLPPVQARGIHYAQNRPDSFRNRGRLARTLRNSGGRSPQGPDSYNRGIGNGPRRSAVSNYPQEPGMRQVGAVSLQTLSIISILAP